MSKMSFKVWRGDKGQGEFKEYTTEITEGMVVLDAMHQNPPQVAAYPSGDAPAIVPFVGTQLKPGVRKIAPEQGSFAGGGEGIVTQIVKVLVVGYPAPAS